MKNNNELINLDKAQKLFTFLKDELELVIDDAFDLIYIIQEYKKFNPKVKINKNFISDDIELCSKCNNLFDSVNNFYEKKNDKFICENCL